MSSPLFTTMLALLLAPAVASTPCNAGCAECVAIPNNDAWASDSDCAVCPSGYEWWPCDQGACECKGDPQPEDAPARVVQYFAQWSIYGRGFRPWHMKLDQITHVNYAFFDVTQACAVASLDEYADFEIIYEELGMSYGDGQEHGNIGAFQILRETHPHLSLVLSLGGWTKSTYFSDCAKSAAKRQVLVSSALAMLRRTGFDGLDLDWEYPVCCGLESNSVDPDDWDNYLLLLGELRAALDAEYPTAHKELSIAMGMGPAVTDEAPKQQLGELLDCINLMTYDYNGAWPPMLTAHNAPLHADPAYEAAGGQAGFNVEWGVSQWTSAVPLSKLVMGMPSYGRSWYGTTELYATADGAGPGTDWGDEYPEDLGILRYDEITSSRFAHFTRHWSEPSMVPYLTGRLEGKEAFITYDDPESIALKARFAKAAGLAGLMWWEASEDPESELLLAGNEAWGEALTPAPPPSTKPPPSPPPPSSGGGFTFTW